MDVYHIEIWRNYGVSLRAIGRVPRRSLRAFWGFWILVDDFSQSNLILKIG